MNEAKDDYCVHRWDGGDPARLCLACGQIRTFPDSPDNPLILWPGKSCTLDPLGLPRQVKKVIAQVAQRGRLPKVEKLTGIPMSTLRAWVGAYCRAPGKQGGPPIAAEAMPVVAPEVAVVTPDIYFTPPIVRYHGRHRIYQF